MKKFIILVLSALLIIPFNASTSNAAEIQNGTAYTVTAPYEYPVLPGTQEWAALQTLEEKIQACAVDESLMCSMTTQALLETVINYPLFANIYAFNSIEDGLASVSSYFQGIELLLQRKDLDSCIQYALQTSPYAASTQDDILRDSYLHILKDYKNGALRSPKISTPGGSTLEVYYNLTWADHGFTKSQAQAAHNRYLAIYPNNVEVSGISPSYNCHSYAWYNASANNCWINDPTPYMSDGSYTKQAGAAKGYKAAWPGTSSSPSVPAHSAIVHSTSSGKIKYISKWGVLGVFIHSAADCPYAGTITYWN